MRFFRKAKPSEKSEMTTEEIVQNTDIQSQKEALTPEEKANQWFLDKYACEMPEECKRMLKQMAVNEAKRQKIGEDLLDENELRRIQENIRLLQTKLTNISQTLAGQKAQKEWLLKFEKLKQTYEKFRQIYFAANKEYNAHLQDIKELERFESFETEQSKFLTIKILEAQIQELRDKSSLIKEKLQDAAEKTKGCRQAGESGNRNLQDILDYWYQMQENFSEGNRIQAKLSVFENELTELEDCKKQIERLLASLKKKAEEQKSELDKISSHKNNLIQQLQVLDNIKKMLEQGDIIQHKLDILLGLKKKKQDLQSSLEEVLKKQKEQNSTLSKLFTTSQEIDAQINTLQSELHVHQNSVIGTDSYALQKRAMELKSKKEQLINAALLWKQISGGYIRVDEKTQEMARLQLSIEALRDEAEKLSTTIAGMRTQCEELKYCYTLSKSQDVMQLRNDLKEGYNCIVCGATHHPYHSDTPLEQSKIIGEQKSSYELALNELRLKENQLQDIMNRKMSEEGKIEIAFEALQTYKQILQENVQHWQNFTSLDKSFAECSPSTNQEARRAMIQQLIEKIGIDAENAQKELDTFNFHQTNINSLNDKLTQKELEKNEIALRLNEVNTSCQVLAYRVEQNQKMLAEANSEYSTLYEELDKTITITNWYSTWLDNHENLKIYIQQQMNKLFSYRKEIPEYTLQEVKTQTIYENLVQEIRYQEKHLGQYKDKIDLITERKEEAEQALYKMFENGDIKQYYNMLRDKLIQAEAERNKAVEAFVEATGNQALRKGESDEIENMINHTEERLAATRSELDIWIRQYNACNSPVQFAEMEQILKEEKNWNDTRSLIRELIINHKIAENKMEEARLALAAHQVNALSQGNDIESRTAALNSEIAKLENEQKNIMTRIAGLDAKLQAHDIARQKMTVSQDNLSI